MASEETERSNEVKEPLDLIHAKQGQSCTTFESPTHYVLVHLLHFNTYVLRTLPSAANSGLQLKEPFALTFLGGGEWSLVQP